MSSITIPDCIVLGSRNRKKSAEIADLLGPHGITVTSVADFEGVPEVIEDGDSFAANAALKATQTAQFLGQWVLAEDSGLCVDALDGSPGIYSARFAGEHANDGDNNQKLMSELEGIEDRRRSAHYVCHVSLSDPDGVVRITEEATCRGQITREPRGENGFGYDPYFLIVEYGRTFGELGSIVKQNLSHRSRAFSRFIPKLLKLRHELASS